MDPDAALVPPSRLERLLGDPVLVVAVFCASVLLALVGYAFDLDVLTGVASWFGGCAFILGLQTIILHRRYPKRRPTD